MTERKKRGSGRLYVVETAVGVTLLILAENEANAVVKANSIVRKEIDPYIEADEKVRIDRDMVYTVPWDERHRIYSNEDISSASAAMMDKNLKNHGWTIID